MSVGCALVGQPPLALVDEPSAGLDPGARAALWQVRSAWRCLVFLLIFRVCWAEGGLAARPVAGARRWHAVLSCYVGVWGRGEVEDWRAHVVVSVGELLE